MVIFKCYFIYKLHQIREFSLGIDNNSIGLVIHLIIMYVQVSMHNSYESVTHATDQRALL